MRSQCPTLIYACSVADAMYVHTKLSQGLPSCSATSSIFIGWTSYRPACWSATLLVGCLCAGLTTLPSGVSVCWSDHPPSGVSACWSDHLLVGCLCAGLTTLLVGCLHAGLTTLLVECLCAGLTTLPSGVSACWSATLPSGVSACWSDHPLVGCLGAGLTTLPSGVSACWSDHLLPFLCGDEAEYF